MVHAERTPGMLRHIGTLGAGAASLLAVPLVLDVRITRASQPLTERWQHLPVAPRHTTLLGLSFRPLQAEALGLDARATLQALLPYPFQIIRLGAYWNRLEPAPRHFDSSHLDWQIDAAERAGKQIILCVGAVKAFGYPEFFAPAHQLPQPLREGTLVTPASHEALLAAATAFITRLVERYRDRKAIVAWQVEHDAVDPLGMEHSWRLAAAFVQQEVDAVRTADPTRPIMMNGYLPTSVLVGLNQGWRTRGQGDSLAVVPRMADIVGVDYYPRHALGRVGAWTLYLDGSSSPWQQRRWRHVCAMARRQGRQLMICEGQAEPWETTTTPPNPKAQGLYSCLPEQVIATYNQCLRATAAEAASLYAYLFWGAEYWVLRQRSGDARYMQAFERIVEQA